MLLIGVLLAAAGLLVFEQDLRQDYVRAHFATPPSTFVQVDDLEAHVRDEGRGAPVVLLHGTSSSLHTWDDWTALLADSLRIIRLDLPGFGLTGPRADRDYRIETYVEFLSAFLDTMQVERAHLAGSSLGGHIAWAFAAEHPDRVDRLILVDPAGHPDHIASPFAFRIARIPVLGDLVRWVDPSPFVSASLHDAYHDPDRLTPQRLHRYRTLTLAPGNRGAFVDRVRMSSDWPFERTRDVKAPVLLMWGESDTWTPFSVAGSYAEAFADARLITYPDAGHVPMEEIPVRTSADARAFLLNLE